MGDVNCDILKPQLDSRSRKLEFLSSFYQFGQIIDCPTRATETSATAIDLIFSDRVENSLQAGTVDFRISDHSLIFPVKALLHGAIFHATCLATPLRDKLHDSLGPCYTVHCVHYNLLQLAYIPATIKAE